MPDGLLSRRRVPRCRAGMPSRGAEPRPPRAPGRGHGREPVPRDSPQRGSPGASPPRRSGVWDIPVPPGCLLPGARELPRCLALRCRRGQHRRRPAARRAAVGNRLTRAPGDTRVLTAREQSAASQAPKSQLNV